jgi:replicative DNA helicase
VTVLDRLRAGGAIEDVGGADYVADLYGSAATGANAAYHAGIVRDHAVRRGLIRAANAVLRDAYAPDGPADELAARAERLMADLAGEAAGAVGGPRPAAAVMRAALDRIDARVAAGGALAGLGTGYPDLDHLLGGLRPGELIVIGARPSQGKTALATNILVNVAGAGEPVLLFSMEMPALDIADRLLSMGSSVPMHRFSRGRGLAAADAERLAAAASPAGLGGCAVYLDDADDQPAARVLAAARKAVRRHGVALIAVDYLQLMRPENPRDNRTIQVGTLARRMKQVARSCNVPVLLLSQLNRESEGQSRRPRLSDLRDSGEIEQHADRVLLLHRDPDLPADQEVWPVEVVVAKNRNGPVGDVTLAYRRPCMRYENHARY